MLDLTNQVALVTGGANGIGKGISESLAEAGAKVIIGDIDEEQGQKTAEALNGKFYKMDVTDKQAVQDIVDQIVKEFDKIDILASNTGVYPQIEIEDLTEEDWDYIQNINLKGMFFVTQAVLKEMKKTTIWPCHHYFFSNWTDYRLFRMGALWCDESGSTRLHA
ncbi:SDR family NAD(P)-dependent oxidoreductase [Staphylococcus pettenkoferi]|uniref:SDR family NAD(P)-dependent oxidoreductase n=1 Tax=Staphylococcus pettenkoferi TaxID=170573 RepID=UPI0021B333FF|nr:SDR family oxidoreductase [Staphylococcus pettenkoferi]